MFWYWFERSCIQGWLQFVSAICHFCIFWRGQTSVTGTVWSRGMLNGRPKTAKCLVWACATIEWWGLIYFFCCRHVLKKHHGTMRRAVQNLSLVMLECEIASVVARFRNEYMLLLSVPNVWFHSELEISHKSECAWLLIGTAQMHIRSYGWIAIARFRIVLKWHVGFQGMHVVPVRIATLCSLDRVWKSAAKWVTYSTQQEPEICL